MQALDVESGPDATRSVDEHTPLLSVQASLLSVSEPLPQDTTQSVVDWTKSYITPVIMPILYALNGSAIPSAITTIGAGWPKKVPKVIAPAMYVGLPFNAIGFLDALAQEYKINRLNKFRHGYRVLINGTNTAVFSLQLLIAILDDIYETKNKPLEVSNADFAGICVGPALLGVITLIVQGRNIQRPSDLRSLKNKIRYALLASLDLINNASTAHSFIQDAAALIHPLTSPSGMLLRYSLALAPALAAEGIKISEHISESWFSSCLQNCPRSFLTYLRSSPEQLFLIISALNYAIFNEEVMRNKEKDFSVAGATIIYLFWFYVFLSPLIVRFCGGLSPSQNSEISQTNDSDLYETFYDVDSPRGVAQEDSVSSDDDLESGRQADYVDHPSAPLARSVVSAGSQQLESRDDLHAAQAAGLVQQLPAEILAPAVGAAIAALPVERVQQQLPVVNDLPLAPKSAHLTRCLSLQAEMQRSALAQQPTDAQQLRRTQSSELMVEPTAARGLNNPLTRST